MNEFFLEMNQFAKDTDSRFNSCDGLANPKTKSTAKDMAIFSQKLL